QPPLSPRSPYPTLFRSLLIQSLALPLHVLQVPERPERGEHPPEHRLARAERERAQIEILETEQVERVIGHRGVYGRVADVDGTEDRKSTRLNSSHQIIS